MKTSQTPNIILVITSGIGLALPAQAEDSGHVGTAVQITEQDAACVHPAEPAYSPYANRNFPSPRYCC